MLENLDTFFILSQEFLHTKAQAYRRYFIKNTQLSERFSLLTGQRGIGKTTLMIQFLLDYVNNDRFSPKILYIPVDHFAIGKTPLYEIAKLFNLMGGEFIAFDEIHKYPNWSMELKSIFDTFPNLKIIASGSSALEIHKGTHDISRRAIVYSIAGLSFREYLELTFLLTLPFFSLDEILSDHHTYCAEKIISTLEDKKLKIIPQFHNYLKYGFYPYYYELNDNTKFEMTLEQNIHTILESDLLAIYPQLSGHSIHRIKQLLAFIAQSVPFTPHWINIKQMLDIGDERTLKTYIKYLQDAQLIQVLYKSSNKLSALENPAKIYLYNPNLMHVLAKNQQNIGTQRETFFLNTLTQEHKVTLPLNGDFLVDQKLLFEIGGKNKDFRQINKQQKSYICSDNLEIGIKNKIPLWLFGFLY